MSREFLSLLLLVAIVHGYRLVNVNTASGIVTACQNAVAGDDIVIAPGSYSMPGKKLSITNRAGTPSERIVLRADAAGTVTLTWTAPNDYIEGLHFTHCPYWSVERLVLKSDCSGYSVDDYCEHVIHLTGASEFFELRESTLVDANAQIKVNGADLGGAWNFPDDGLIEACEFYDTAVRRTTNPVNKINIDGGRRWMVRLNYIHDYAKEGSAGVGFAAYFKGGHHNGVMMQNVVECERLHTGGGPRIGITIGNTMGPDNLCEDGACYPSCHQCQTQNNIHFNCPDDTSYFNQWAPDVQNAHEVGFELQYRWTETTNAQPRNNIFSNRIRLRDSATLGASSTPNIELYDPNYNGMFTNPSIGDFSLVTPDDTRVIGQAVDLPYVTVDFCGNLRGPAPRDMGPIEYTLYAPHTSQTMCNTNRPNHPFFGQPGPFNPPGGVTPSPSAAAPSASSTKTRSATPSPVSSTSTPTRTPVSITSTPSSTPLSATSTPSPTPVSATSTPSSTPVSATSTPSSTPLSVTSTPTRTPVSASSTPSGTPVTASPTVSNSGSPGAVASSTSATTSTALPSESPAASPSVTSTSAPSAIPAPSVTSTSAPSAIPAPSSLAPGASATVTLSSATPSVSPAAASVTPTGSPAAASVTHTGTLMASSGASASLAASASSSSAPSVLTVSPSTGVQPSVTPSSSGSAVSSAAQSGSLAPSDTPTSSLSLGASASPSATFTAASLTFSLSVGSSVSPSSSPRTTCPQAVSLTFDNTELSAVSDSGILAAASSVTGRPASDFLVASRKQTGADVVAKLDIIIQDSSACPSIVSTITSSTTSDPAAWTSTVGAVPVASAISSNAGGAGGGGGGSKGTSSTTWIIVGASVGGGLLLCIALLVFALLIAVIIAIVAVVKSRSGSSVNRIYASSQPASGGTDNIMFSAGF